MPSSEHGELAGDRPGFILHTHQWAEQTTDDRAKYYCNCTEPKLLLQFQLITDLSFSLKQSRSWADLVSLCWLSIHLSLAEE